MVPMFANYNQPRTLAYTDSPAGVALAAGATVGNVLDPSLTYASVP